MNKSKPKAKRHGPKAPTAGKSDWIDMLAAMDGQTREEYIAEQEARDMKKSQFEAQYLKPPGKRLCRLTVVVRDYLDVELETGDLTTEKARGELLKAVVEEYRNQTGDDTVPIRFDVVDFDEDEFELTVYENESEESNEVLSVKTDFWTRYATEKSDIHPYPNEHSWKSDYRIPSDE